MSYLTKIFIIISLVAGCSSPEKSEQEKIREQNAKGEFIYRKSNEHFATPRPLTQRARPPYPWQDLTERPTD